MDVLSPRMHFFVIVWFNNFFCDFVPSKRDTTILGWRPPELEVSAINSIFCTTKVCVQILALTYRVFSSLFTINASRRGLLACCGRSPLFSRRVWSWKDVFVWLIYTTVSNKARFDGDYDRKCFLRVYGAYLQP